MIKVLFSLCLLSFGWYQQARAQKPLVGNYCTAVADDSTYYCFDFQSQQVQFHYNAGDYRTVGVGKYSLSPDSLVLFIDSGIIDKKNIVAVTEFDISATDSNELVIMVRGAKDKSLGNVMVNVYRTDAFGAVEMAIDTVYHAAEPNLTLKISKDDAFYFVKVSKEGYQEYVQEFINDANRLVDLVLQRSDYSRVYAEGNIYRYQILSRTKNNLVLKNVMTEKLLDLRLEKSGVQETEDTF